MRGVEMSTDTYANPEPAVARPPFWFRMSVTVGNVVQIVGLLVGPALIYWAAHAHFNGVVRVVLMLLAWIVVYICCHSLGHYVVGRALGIRFKGYGLRG